MFTSGHFLLAVNTSTVNDIWNTTGNIHSNQFLISLCTSLSESSKPRKTGELCWPSSWHWLQLVSFSLDAVNATSPQSSTSILHRRIYLRQAHCPEWRQEAYKTCSQSKYQHLKTFQRERRTGSRCNDQIHSPQTPLWERRAPILCQPPLRRRLPAKPQRTPKNWQQFP